MRANWRTLDPGPRVVDDRSRRDARDHRRRQRRLSSGPRPILQVRNVYRGIVGPACGEGRRRPAARRLRHPIGPGRARRRSPSISPGGRVTARRADFVTLSDIPRDVRVLSYSQSFVNPRVERAQTLLAFFAEDTFRVASTLSVTAGVRWDYDSVTNTPHRRSPI